MERTPTPGDDSPMQGLVAFFGTASMLLLALLVAQQLRPAWFGLVSAEAEPVGFAPRDLPGGAPTERVPSARGLAERVFRDSAMSVVHVTKRSLRASPTVLDEFVSGTGSGLVWDTRGHIVTCAHVFEGASGAKVTFGDGRQFEARLVARDASLDLAVVRVDVPPGELVPVRLGTSDGLNVGQNVFSISCPYGLGPSISQGIVSGLRRTLRSTTGVDLEGTIQVDAPMHAGSSGGALLDDQARLVGMNAAIYLGSRRQAGVGFALPVDQVVEAVPRLINLGYSWAPRFGFLTYSDMESEGILRKIRGVEGAPEAGVVVSLVEPDGPADRAGLLQSQEQIVPDGQGSIILKDVIVGAMGQPVTCRADLDSALDALEPSETLSLTVARRSGRVMLDIEPSP